MIKRHLYSFWRTKILASGVNTPDLQSSPYTEFGEGYHEREKWLVKEGLLAIVRGAFQQAVYVPHQAFSQSGTKEVALNDVLLARSNANMLAIKQAYRATYMRL